MSNLSQFFGRGSGSGFGSAGNYTQLNSIYSQASAGSRILLVVDPVPDGVGTRGIGTAKYIYSQDSGATWSASGDLSFRAVVDNGIVNWGVRSTGVIDSATGNMLIVGGSAGFANPSGNFEYYYSSGGGTDFVKRSGGSNNSGYNGNLIGAYHLNGVWMAMFYDATNQRQFWSVSTDPSTPFSGISVGDSTLSWFGSTQRAQEAVYIHYRNGSLLYRVAKATNLGAVNPFSPLATLPSNVNNICAGGAGTANGLAHNSALVYYTTDEWATLTASTLPAFLTSEFITQSLWSESKGAYYLYTSAGRIFKSTDATGSSFSVFPLESFLLGGHAGYTNSSAGGVSNLIIMPPSIANFGYLYSQSL